MVPTDQYIISPLYRVIDEHAGAATLIVAVVLLFIFAKRSRPGTTGSDVYERYSKLEPMPKVAFWALMLSSASHLGLVFGHEVEPISFGYLAASAAMAYVARAVLGGGRWRRSTSILLGGSLLAFVISSVTGTPPDQVAMFTKLTELVGLAAALSPYPGARFAKAGALSVVGITFIVSVGSWAGAFSSADGGHHHGETPPPAVALPQGEDREPTVAEQAAADDLHAAMVEALKPYEDPAVAAAAGYEVDGIEGFDFHADNPQLKNDGRVMDPEFPETLVYAMGPGGPVLLGAMFSIDDIGVTGPAVGGPLTVWHAHDHVCLSFTGMTGAVGPFGMCSFGSIAIPITNEMIHVFVLDDAPDRFGDLSDDWIKEAVGF